MSVRLEVSARESFNFAANNFKNPFIPSLTVFECGGKNVCIRISAKPEFVYEYRLNVQPTSNVFTVSDISLTANEVCFRKYIQEAKEGVLDIELSYSDEPEKVIASHQLTVNVQPYLHWARQTDEASAVSFLQPNSTAVAKIIKRAGELANLENSALYAYQHSDTAPTDKQAKWIFKAIAEAVVHYCELPASFERSGQKLRIPEMVLSDDYMQGNCIDLSILYSSCLEAAGIHPLIFLVEGHAFAGFWMKQDSALTNMIVKDKSEIAPLIWNPFDGSSQPENAIVPIECTHMTDAPNYTPSFEAAVESAVKSFNEKAFESVIDIRESRKCAYYPVFTLPIGNDAAEPQNIEESGTVAPELESEVTLTPVEEKLSKLERLQRQAMEFDFGSSLVSMDRSQAIIEFSLDAAKLFSGEYSLDAPYKAFCDGCDDACAFLLDMMKRQREAEKELGSGIVFMTVGKLTWSTTDGRTAVSPLYVIPLEIFRNQRGETVFTPQIDGCTFNPALKEVLHEEYGINLTELLDRPDGKYAEQIKLLEAIIDGKKWEVCENTASVGVFKMPNAALYRALHSEKLLEHPIVKGILDGSMTWNNDTEAAESTKCNIYPFAADSSQRKVIESLPHKRAQVVFGPAGNGKSQTIANIIALKMSRGEPVLFVAEKLAAQQVIYDKLKELGLDGYCLMMPTEKRSISEVCNTLEKALKLIGRHRATYVSTVALKKYDKLTDELRSYYEQLRKRNENGASILELLLEAERYRDVKDIFDGKFLTNHLRNPNAADMMQAMADFYAEADPTPVRDIRLFRGLEESFEKKEEYSRLISDVLVGKAEISDAADDFANALGIFDIANDTELCLEYIDILGGCPVVGKTIPNADPMVIEELALISNKLTILSPSSIEYLDLYERFTELMRISDENADTADELPYDGGYRVSGAIRPEQRRRTANVKAFQNFERDLCNDTRVRTKEHRYALFTAGRAIARREADELLTAAKKLRKAVSAYGENREKAMSSLVRTNAECSDERLFEMWQEAAYKDLDYSKYAKAYDRFKNAGFGTLFATAGEKIADGEATPDEIIRCFEKARCTEKLNRLLAKLPDSIYVDGMSDSSRISRIQNAEDEARKELRAKLLEDTVAHMPDIRSGVSDDPALGAVQKFIRRATGSIRELFSQGGDALVRICPCMIMSPEAVAAAIPDDFPMFDTVIFDEGSQLPTYKALPAVAKAENCLVIGDEKQLTPTSFFVKTIEDENGNKATREAILEDAIVCSMPQLMLSYHYRSKHESLVAFSNDRYYGGEIVSFPDNSIDRVGLDYVFVRDGLYEIGTSRSNYPEAKRVAELADEIYCSLPSDTDKTLGIITFNIEQKKLIDAELAKRVTEKNGAYEKLMTSVDVVNLEACQGKEWDITIISPAYGPDSDGKLPTNFGPMNREEGRNRLNVIITRAKEHMYIVSSMRPDMFAENAKNGAADLRDFISYASGDTELDTKTTAPFGRSADIVESICAKLSEHGYNAHSDIGCSECKIDIGVLDDSGKNYVLGILLDDFDGYFDVIDKETLIPSMLSRKGWKLYRLHTVNWYKESEGEISNILKLLR